MFSTRCLFAYVAGAMIALPGAAQVATERQLAPHQHIPVRVHERHFDGTVSSENWSGYAVTGAAGSVTDAKASWIVPAVTCGSGRRATSAYSSFWVGIDGYSSSTVEQTGTDSDCSGSEPVYYAWYEFYPQPSFEVTNFSVKPGDKISAEVSYSNGEFTATLTNERTGKTFSTSAQVASAQRSSAEWIAEAPSSCGRRGCQVLPLADFGTVDLGEDYTGVANSCFATINGTKAAIGSFGANVSAITMVSASGAKEAVPSGFSAADGSSFSVTWK